MTQPRRVAATTLANRVAEEMGSSLGQLVGYSVRLDECFDRQKTKIKFMTEGILVTDTWTFLSSPPPLWIFLFIKPMSHLSYVNQMYIQAIQLTH